MLKELGKRNQRKTDIPNSLAGEPLALCRFLDRLSHGGMLQVDVDVEGHVLAVAIGDDHPTPIYFGTFDGGNLDHHFRGPSIVNGNVHRTSYGIIQRL
jgi:hypothetical protein